MESMAVKLHGHSEFLSEATGRLTPDADRRRLYIDMVHQVAPEITVPTTLAVELRQYQIEGLEWLCSLRSNKLSGLLADEMGLGKTIQTLALIAQMAEVHGIMGPHLVVCPVSVVENWRAEIQKCLPTVFPAEAVVLWVDKNTRSFHSFTRTSK